MQTREVKGPETLRDTDQSGSGDLRPAGTQTRDNIIVYDAYKILTSELMTHRLNVRVWKEIFHANGNEKKSQGSNTHIRQISL